ncbi:hypothetical protein FSARC_8897 [Fusarium sarcochroum]|uniref:Uncharacterized protein n=1 Tax=Fusarium sarcochroum TaxID=1208366 RepID=A0A8H4TS32_9HYPO|nr:hypothetical protein FSARC_8897 [Fusarium sarcochroum]
MSNYTYPLTTTITDAVEDIRKKSDRSRYIAKLINNMKVEQVEHGTMNLLGEVLKDFVCESNMDLAMTTFNLHRFPFNTITPTGNNRHNWSTRNGIRHTNAWNVIKYYTETIGDWKRLREFLELCDNMNQLSSTFAAVPNPEHYWNTMYRLWNTPADQHPHTGETRGIPPDPNWSPNRCCLGVVRSKMHKAVLKNPPGKQPTKLDGDLIDMEYFASVQREFWWGEFMVRRYHLETLYHYNVIPRNVTAMWQLYHWGVTPTILDMKSFKSLVSLQRLMFTSYGYGINDNRMINSTARIIGWKYMNLLGMQVLALCLPRRRDNYEMRLLFQLGVVKTQWQAFWENFPASDYAWYDGWFEKYPVSGPIDHVFLDIDYSGEDNGEDE